ERTTVGDRAAVGSAAGSFGSGARAGFPAPTAGRGGAGVAGEPSRSRKASTTARAEEGRSAGFLASSRRVRSASAGGTAGLSSRHGGASSPARAGRNAIVVMPRNGSRPAQSRQRRTPRLDQSLPAPTPSPPARPADIQLA